jgi:hypothetical protein
VKRTITLALVLLAAVVFAAPPIGSSMGKWAVGTLHAAAADTADLGSFLYGANWARFYWQGDTIVDTVSYYKMALQVKPFPGSAWSASIAFTDSLHMNHEATATTAQYTTDTMPGSAKFLQLVGVYPYARLIMTPTLAVAARGIKNCTLWVVRYKE